MSANTTCGASGCFNTVRLRAGRIPIFCLPCSRRECRGSQTPDRPGDLGPLTTPAWVQEFLARPTTVRLVKPEKAAVPA